MSRHHHQKSRRYAPGGDEKGRSGETASANSETPTRSSRRSKRRASSRRESAAARTPRGKRYSLYCLVFAFASIALIALAELIAHAQQGPTLMPLNLLGAAATAGALVTGTYSIASLVRHDSRTVRRRLLVGMPIAVCAGLAVTSNFFDKHRHLAPPESGATYTAPNVAKTPENDELVKPGWFGEILTDGLLVTITSFEENAVESRRFNRGLFKPVNYATLTVVNAGHANPISVKTVEASLLLKDGTTADSLSLFDLLSHGAGQNESLHRRLTENQTLSMGGMLVDVPICTDTNLSWSQVIAVNVRLGARIVVVPGRIMTAKEKSELLQKSLAPQPASTNRPAATA